jgi:hypothetical protein
MAKTITLKFEGKCADPNCGAVLAVGTKAKWYGRGKVYGLDCHSSPWKGQRKRKVNYFYSPTTGNEWSQNANGRCEDAPCCGCCTR